jgi:hypothetical protein
MMKRLTHVSFEHGSIRVWWIIPPRPTTFLSHSGPFTPACYLAKLGAIYAK